MRLPRDCWGQADQGRAGRWAQGSLPYLLGQGNDGRPRRGVCVWERPACSVRRPPSLHSLHLVRCARGLHTAQLENVTSLERFPRALPGSPPPRQAPSAYFSSLAPQPPAAWGARWQRLGPGSRPLRAAASGALRPAARACDRGRWEQRRGAVPPASRPPRGPRLLVRPRTQSRVPSRRVEAVAGHTGRRGPREERGALGLRPREQRRDGAQPDRQAAAAHRRRPRVPTWPHAGPPPVSARRAAPPLTARVPPPLAAPAARWPSRLALRSGCVPRSGRRFSRLGPRRGGGRRALRGLA